MAKDAAPVVSVVEKAAYPMPSVALPPPVLDKAVAAPSAAAPKEYVVAPARGTLAAGRWEAKPSTIWIVVALAAVALLGWALFRVRREAAARRRQVETLTSIRKSMTTVKAD